MKKYLLLYKILLLSLPGISQITISSGTQWVTSGAVTINIQDLNMVNNGTFAAGNSTVKFTGSTPNSIGGSSALTFYQLEIGKTGDNALSLLFNITVNNAVNFTSGLIDLNQKNINLGSGALLNNESETSRIIGPAGGEVIISMSMNKPNSVNAGNLGAIISSNSNLQTVTIKRGHMTSTGNGLTSSINRYFNITNGGNNINATLRFKYFDAELNGQSEPYLNLFQSTNNGTAWTNQSFTTRDAAANYVEKNGLSTLALTTLAAYVPPPPPPPPAVTGLVFTVSRTNNTTAQLNWSTATENNMLGFEVQRKLDNEADFTARTFVNSLAPGGNSNTTLNYAYADANSYTSGTTYYRLKIVDQNNNFTYSDIKSIAKVKGKGGNARSDGYGETELTDISKDQEAKKITVGPNPNNGNFWFTVSGIEKETVATLYTIDGKVLQQFRVTNQQHQQVNGLSNGIYLLKVPGMDAFKVVVQGSSAATTTVQNFTPFMIKN